MNVDATGGKVNPEQSAFDRDRFRTWFAKQDGVRETGINLLGDCPLCFVKGALAFIYHPQVCSDTYLRCFKVNQDRQNLWCNQCHASEQALLAGFASMAELAANGNVDEGNAPYVEAYLENARPDAQASASYQHTPVNGKAALPFRSPFIDGINALITEQGNDHAGIEGLRDLKCPRADAGSHKADRIYRSSGDVFRCGECGYGFDLIHVLPGGKDDADPKDFKPPNQPPTERLVKVGQYWRIAQEPEVEPDAAQEPVKEVDQPPVAPTIEAAETVDASTPSVAVCPVELRTDAVVERVEGLTVGDWWKTRDRHYRFKAIHKAFKRLSIPSHYVLLGNKSAAFPKKGEGGNVVDALKAADGNFLKPWNPYQAKANPPAIGFLPSVSGCYVVDVDLPESHKGDPDGWKAIMPGAKRMAAKLSKDTGARCCITYSNSGLWILVRVDGKGCKALPKWNYGGLTGDTRSARPRDKWLAYCSVLREQAFIWALTYLYEDTASDAPVVLDTKIHEWVSVNGFQKRIAPPVRPTGSIRGHRKIDWDARRRAYRGAFDTAEVSGELKGQCPHCGGIDRFHIKLNEEAMLCRHCVAQVGTNEAFKRCTNALDSLIRNG